LGGVEGKKKKKQRRNPGVGNAGWGPFTAWHRSKKKRREEKRGVALSIWTRDEREREGKPSRTTLSKKTGTLGGTRVGGRTTTWKELYGLTSCQRKSTLLSEGGEWVSGSFGVKDIGDLANPELGRGER